MPDSCIVDVVELTVKNANCGLATYVKKTEFGESRLTARAVHFENVASAALAQAGCRLIIDGNPVPGQTVDVEELYRNAAKPQFVHGKEVAP